MDVIYLDNAATTWPKPEPVLKSVENCMANYGANPGRGGHRLSRLAGGKVEETRRRLARLFQIRDPRNLIFCQNGTHGINLSLKGWLNPGDHVVATTWEHNAVVRPLEMLKKTRGIEVDYIPPGSEEPVDLHRLEKALGSRTRLIVANHASNVTGVLLPVGEIGNIARRRGIPLLVDAAQTAGVVPIDVESMGISMLAFSGHKGLMGPQGTGGLYISPELSLRPLMEGGTGSHSEHLWQPEERPTGFESGTPNTPGIAGLDAGVQFLSEQGMESIRQHESLLAQQISEGLSRMEGIRVYTPGSSSVPVVSFNVEGVDGNEVAAILDQHYEIAVRSGFHCAALAHQTLGTADTGTIRVSPGFFNTDQDVEALLQAVGEIRESYGMG
ncbi:aminotransferase class V-fold PLP-dependent enzyme [Kroppenstedtia eburnea]|uniref:aminotransferase class V-fold PLP-dependent enzyme n=1 Tax=Kroppenstedtia eburnea TaxID=714067 RepID=UPI0009707A5A|nr:aminotransferase class V-fold PLP-dependent enzyme [Kroppenstedtia eburnea]QKI83598.1 aminotransferase class V-fold PLP-dependent enzyme [Kroppenstedtia eburnea]